MKKRILLMLVIISIAAISVTSFAGIVQPEYVAACDESPDGKHHFDSIGFSKLYNPTVTTVLFNGGAYYKCIYCGQELASEMNYWTHNGNIGHWALRNDQFTLLQAEYILEKQLLLIQL